MMRSSALRKRGLLFIVSYLSRFGGITELEVQVVEPKTNRYRLAVCLTRLGVVGSLTRQFSTTV